MEEKEKIDVNGENETIGSKIDKFCSVLMKMPFPSAWTMVSEEENLKLVESEIIRNLFSDLEKKNKFTDDQDVYDKTGIYCKALEINQRPNNAFGKATFIVLTGKTVEDVIKDQPSFNKYQSKFKEMTNREFLKKFIKQKIDLNKLFRAMPKWKRICLAFLGFVPTVSGIVWLLYGISAGSKLTCFIGILVMCAWAGLICSLVFHLSLAVLIPSAIILGIAVIASLISTILSYVSVYPIRQKYGTDIDDFFNLVGEINQYLDTFDLTQKKISSNKKRIYEEQSIDEKIKDANTKKDDAEKSNIKIEKGNNEEDKEE